MIKIIVLLIMHYEIYIKYCDACWKKYIHVMFNQHNKHDIISCENIIPEIANIVNSLIKLKNSIDIFKSDIII